MNQIPLCAVDAGLNGKIARYLLTMKIINNFPKKVGGEKMGSYDLLVIFTDGSEKIISKVEEAGIKDDVFGFKKNGYWGMLPKENVRYFGRLFDWEN